MNPPLVSVMTLTYNHGKYIRQCLEGILMQQTNFRFEIIVGDDCSTDNTQSIIREFEEKYPDIVKPIYHQKNVGALRNAFEYCYPRLTGKYIALCEGDDYWTDPFKLQKQVDFLEQHTECVISFHRVNWVNPESEIIKHQEAANEIQFYSWQDIFHIHIPTLSAVFRNCLKFDYKDIEKVFSADAFVFAMLSRYGGAADLGFVGANYRVHSGGIFSQKSKLDQYREAIYVRKLMQRSPVFTVKQKKEIGKELAKRKSIYMKHFIKEKEMLNCIKIMLA
ncbi:MAG TPA: glycosyltransferase [Chitinophagaceae bacterium]|jgi:glycosyltransferase involved in cell wall biosynthesis|nr:glycosyltransferase [Chitinophagaceae bacterium]